MSVDWIHLNLVDPADTVEEAQIQTELERLVNGETSAAAVANIIDEVVATDCQDTHDDYTKSGVKIGGTEQDNEEVATRTPQPLEWQNFICGAVGRASAAIPSEHVGHQRLANLLQELQNIPVHSVPWLANGGLMEKELWILSQDNDYDYYMESMREID
jgi:hypothetical protein